jgi:hypothetical protein
MKIIKRRVVQQWLSGESRDKIAADNNISSGTVTSIVDNYKIGLDNLDFGSFREWTKRKKPFSSRCP